MLAVCLLIGAPARAGGRVALVIGNSAYEHVPPLANPTRDAMAVGAALRRLRFDHVTILKDLGAEALRRALLDFEPKVAGADIAIVYYAGHGIEVDGQNFVIPIDARLVRAVAAELEAIPLSSVTTVLSSAQKLRLVILDACRSNPFRVRISADGAVGRKRSIGRGLGRIEPGENELIAFAAAAGTEADDGSELQSPFTAALLKHIESPGLDVRILFGRIRDEVLVATQRQQTPHVYGTLGGEVITLSASTPSSTNILPAPKTPPAPKVTSAVPPPAPAVPSWPSSQSAWVKLCDKGTLTAKDKAGRDEKKDLNICMTHHERIDSNSGMLILSAALHNTKHDGKESNHFRVMVPAGMLLPAGMRISIFPKDVWDKVIKNEKIEKADEGKVKTLKLSFTHCHQVGCVAEVEATPEIVTNLKTNAGLRVFTIGLSGAPIGFDVPLAGFDKALAGPPVDTKKYSEARKQLMQQIAQRQQELKKQQENLNKMQPNVTPAPAKK